MNIAHIRTTEDGQRIQTVEEHCRNVANITAKNLVTLDLYHTGYLAGLLHDIGKCTHLFDEYIKASFKGEIVRRGSVNHTFAGVIFLFERYFCINAKTKDDILRNLTCEIISYSIGAHHGLFDCISIKNESGFDYRLEKNRKEICYDEAINNFCKWSSLDEIDKEFEIAINEIANAFSKIKKNSYETITNRSNIKIATYYLLGMLQRTVLAALIDADREDTMNFMQDNKESIIKVNSAFWLKELSFMENKLSILNSNVTQSEINIRRQYFSNILSRGIEEKYGIYKLNLPTGAGKTLSTLRFALKQASKFEKKHIIFLMPFLSILDQNSHIIRKFISNKDIILEHHSNIIKDDMNSNELNRYELLSESWDAPIIISTLVQFLNILFDGRTTSIRRMIALMDSVIVIDEVQSLPPNLMYMFTLAMDFLAYFCNSTIVFCSATMPEFDTLDYRVDFSKHCDLISYNEKDWEPFKRNTVNLKYYINTGISCDEVTQDILEIISNVKSLLVICNTKKSASEIFNKLLNKNNFRLFYISTSLCMVHRKKVLDDINDALRSDEKIICIATQLVEAGVDFSFESVIRMEAGLDNFIQSAGRCNRNGEYNKLCQVYLMKLQDDNMALSRLPSIQKSRESMEELLYYHQNFQGNEDAIFENSSIKEYYNYWNINSSRNFSYTYNGEELFDLLSVNKKHALAYQMEHNNCGHVLLQAFNESGKDFKVFYDNTIDVIVPYGNSLYLIDELRNLNSWYELTKIRNVLDRLKPYTISIYEWQKKTLEEQGKLESLFDDSIYILDASAYDSDYLGLIVKNTHGALIF